MQWPDSSHRNIATSLEGFRVLTRFLRSFSTAQQENFANSVFCCYSHNSKTPTLISPQPLNRIEPFNLLHSSIWLEEDSGERSNKGDWILTELQEDKNRSSFPYCQNSVRPHYFGGISMNTCPIINFIWSKPSSRLDGSLEKRISANGQGKQKLLRSTWFFSVINNNSENHRPQRRPYLRQYQSDFRSETQDFFVGQFRRDHTTSSPESAGEVKSYCGRNFVKISTPVFGLPVWSSHPNFNIRSKKPKRVPIDSPGTN